MSKHSPGPWRWGDLEAEDGRDWPDDELRAADGTIILVHTVGPRGMDRRLIAAAPRLLEALREALPALEVAMDEGQVAANVVERARALMREVEGE